MKNFIKYFYDFDVSNLERDNNIYFFNYKDEFYAFEKCEDLELLLELYEILQINYKSYNYKFVFNKENSIVTFIDDIPYVMILINCNYKNSIELKKINTNYSIKIKKKSKLIKFYWPLFWQKKIDILELNVGKLNLGKNELSIFYYFIGMCENAIQLFYEVNKKFSTNYFDDLIFCHRRVDCYMSNFDFYNPINIIVDHKSRDISELLKSVFIKNNYNIKEIDEILNLVKLSNYGANLLFLRLLYPSFYFDSLDLYFENSNTEILSLYNYNFINRYKFFLIQIYQLLIEKYDIISIDWLLNAS